MPQTILGFLGILLASFLSLSQMRSGMGTERQLEAADIQAVAAEVAMGQLEALERLPYDQGVVSEYADAISDLTPYAANKYVRIGQDDPNDDLDDVHGSVTTTSHVIRAGEDPLVFKTTTSVRYVSEADATTISTVPTRFKRATVTVRSTSGTASPVVLSQLYSCGSYCTW